MKQQKGGSPPLARGTDYILFRYSCQAGITPACAGNRKPPLGGIFYKGDHPRLRGEQPDFFAKIEIFLGSPPLARGTEEAAEGSGILEGITPACAGNSARRSHPPGLLRDHPRLRGEQFTYPSADRHSIGSPPLARGTAFEEARGGVSDWDHPRLRGEQPVKSLFGAQGGGSPPLARGTDAFTEPELKKLGITPACAGNSGLKA